MQQRMVVSWLAQHNFPHGMLAFMDGLSAEPLRQKTNYLRHLVQEVCNALNSVEGKRVATPFLLLKHCQNAWEWRFHH